MILINIGDELLLGQVINTNAAFIGQQMALAGIEMTECVTIGDDESATYGDFIADDRTESQADAADRNLLKERIAEVLKGLTERERIVMESRYGLKDGVQRTLDEVGLLFNVTRERIRQIEMSALEKLREGKCVAMLAEFFSP